MNQVMHYIDFLYTILQHDTQCTSRQVKYGMGVSSYCVRYERTQ